ncbi:MAG: hypothetical protein JKP98_02535 [Rhodobacteraceae bacterium]|nr:hypothetical protein [Paracoccaceae bacterium]
MTKDSNTGGHPFDASPATAGDETAEALAYRAYRLAQIGREAAPDGDDAAGALAALFGNRRSGVARSFCRRCARSAVERTGNRRQPVNDA